MRSEMESNLELTALANGARIATLADASAPTAMVALEVRGGARAQTPEEGGFAHLLEHLLMAPDAPVAGVAGGQARYFASLGGQVNGYAGREHLALVGHVPASDAVRLAAHFVDRTIDFIPKQAEVAFELVRMDLESHGAQSQADDGDSQLLHCVWGEHPLCNPMYPRTFQDCVGQSDALGAFWRRMLVGPAVTLLAVGQIDHAEFADVGARLDVIPDHAPSTLGGPPRFARGKRQVFASGHAVRAGTHWVLPIDDGGAIAQWTAQLLCGTQDAVLFRALRTRGVHVYGLDATHLQYSDGGVLMFACAAYAKLQRRADDLIEASCASLADTGLSTEDFEDLRARMHAKALLEAAHLECRLEQLAARLRCPELAHLTAPTRDALNEWFRQAWRDAARVSWA